MKITMTDLGIQKLGPGEHFDTRTPAFGIRIGKHRRTWFLMKGERRQKFTLGTYPALSLADARRKALVAMGSPLAPKSDTTYPEALQAFLGQDRWRPGSKRVIESSLKHFSWRRPLAKITHEDVATAIEAIAHKSARAHALKDIRTFFNWCVPRYLPSSPCVGLKMESQVSRERVLTDDELVKVWKAAEQLGGSFGTIVRLLILTGQRRSEIGGLQSEWIELNGTTARTRIVLPPSATKNAREHSFPIATTSISILKSATAQPGTPFLFPARGGSGKSFNGWSKSHTTLLKLSGTNGWTLHDLRRTFATGLAALNVPIHVTEKLLNHVSGSLSGVASIYNRHIYWTEQVAAVAAWEAHLQKLLNS